jgi:hypothetical protein
MIDLIKCRLDVKFYDPVILPTSLSRGGNCLLSRFTRPVSPDGQLKLPHLWSRKFPHPVQQD